MPACHIRSVFALLLTAIAAPLFAGEGSAKPFATNVFGQQYPKYVHHQSFGEQTFIVLSATAADEPLIWSVDHQTGEWQGPVQVGENQLPPRDQHGNPSLVIDDAGYLHVWYGGHGRITSKHVYARSKEPADISEWIHPPFDTRMTYPMAHVMSNGDVCVLYRRGNHSMPGSAAWVLRRSSDHGLTWSEPTVVVQAMTRKTAADLYCVPEKYPGEDRLGIGISDEYLPGSPSKHSTSHLFYVVYDAATGTIRNVAGQELPGQDGVSIETLREHCLVADYKALGNRNKRVSARPVITADGTVHLLAPNGNPAGFPGQAEGYDEKNKAASKASYGGRPRLWRWAEGKWQATDPESNIAYWAEAEGNALVSWRGAEGGAKQRVRSEDHGATWQPTATVQMPDDADAPVAILFNTGHRPPLPKARAVFIERGDGAGNRAWLWAGEEALGR